jgi:hypothetical protein
MEQDRRHPSRFEYDATTTRRFGQFVGDRLLKPEETLAWPVVPVAGLLAALVRQIAEALRSSEVHAQSDPAAVVSG